MKKLAMLLALVMTCNLFATTSFVSAEPAAASTTPVNNFFSDFTGGVNTTNDGKSTAALPTGLTGTGHNNANVFYKDDSDANHGRTLGLYNNGGFYYSFGENYMTDTTVEFDLWVKNPSVSKLRIGGLAETSSWGWNWDASMMTNVQSTNLSFNANDIDTNDPITYPIEAETWYTLRFEIMYKDNAQKPTVAYFVNDTLLGSITFSKAFDRFLFAETGGTSEIRIDNLSITDRVVESKYPVLDSEDDLILYDDFDGNAVKRTEATPTGWRAYSDSNKYDNRLHVIDADQEISATVAGTTGLVYDYAATLTEDTTIEVDVYVANENMDKQVFFGGISGTNIWDNTYLFHVSKDAITFANGEACAITPKTWYRVKVELDYDQDDTPEAANYYVNGTAYGSSTNRIAMAGFMAKGNSATKMSVYFDNVAIYKTPAPAATETPTEAPTEAPTPTPTVAPTPVAPSSINFESDFTDGVNTTNDGKSTAALPAGLYGTGHNNANVFYKDDTDTNHGRTLGLYNNGGFYYYFGENYMTDTTVEFDLWVKNPSVSKLRIGGLAEDSSWGWNWNASMMTNVQSTDLLFTGSQLFESTQPAYTIAAETWNTVRFEIMYDGNAQKPTVAYYVNDTFKGANTFSTAFDRFLFAETGGTSEIRIDNLSIKERVVANPTPAPEMDNPEEDMYFYDDFNSDAFQRKGATFANWTKCGGGDGYLIRAHILDPEHKISAGVSGNEGVQHEFGTTLATDTTVEFDVYATDITSTTNKVFFEGLSDTRWDSDMLFYVGNGVIGLPNTTVAIANNTWHRVKVELDYEDDDTPTAYFYVDGVAYGSQNRGAYAGLKVWSEKMGDGTPVYFDNVAVYKTPTPEPTPTPDPTPTPEPSNDAFFDFNGGDGTSIPSAENHVIYTATLPEGINLVGDNWATHYRINDNEHNVSLAQRGNSKVSYNFLENFQGNVKVSFEMLASTSEKNADNDALFVQIGTGPVYDGKTMLIRQSGTEIMFQNSNNVRTYSPNRWYKFDLDITYDEVNANYIVRVYMDGEFIHERTVAALDSLCFAANNKDANYTLVDNLSIKYDDDATTFAASADIVAPDAIDGNYFEIAFDETVDPLTWDLDVAVTKQVSGAAATAAEVDYALLNDDRNGATVYLAEDLSFDTVYTVTLAEGVRSIYGKALASSNVAVSTTEAEFAVTPVFGSSNATIVAVTEGEIHATGDGVAWRVVDPQEGIVKISFDLKSEYTGDGTTSKLSPYFALNEDMKDDVYLKWPERETNNCTVMYFSELDGEERHYDVLVNLDTGYVTYVIDGGTINTYKYQVTDLTQFVFHARTNNKLDVTNISISYHDSVAEFTTDLTDVVAPTKDSITISFTDTANLETLESIVLNKVNADGSFGEVLWDNIDGDANTVMITGVVLEDGANYVLDLSGVKTTLGVSYANSKVYFTAMGFNVNDAQILDGAAEITNSWDNSKAYTVSIDATNTGDATTVQAIVAGYSAEGLVGVQVVPVPILMTGKSTANMTAMNLSGATTVKVFVLDNLDTLLPILQTPAVYTLAQ